MPHPGGLSGLFVLASPVALPSSPDTALSSFRHCGRGIPGTGAHGPRLGHCSAGPGLHPAAAEHPHLPSDSESPVPIPVLTCLLLAPDPFPLPPQTTCTCCRKSRGKLDLFSTKDSYHPMAEYPPYQSHGRYVSPNSKPNPYSQVRADNGVGAGTFTYTDPAATSDNL
uniref:Uncharacterized protein n=1 Tax=Accipiter nisus TaxID=211598 RepID=A0A8B9N702_9AVES